MLNCICQIHELLMTFVQQNLQVYAEATIVNC